MFLADFRSFIATKVIYMPRHCIAVGCNTVSGEGYSLHAFPLDQGLRAKCI